MSLVLEDHPVPWTYDAGLAIVDCDIYPIARTPTDLTVFLTQAPTRTVPGAQRDRGAQRGGVSPRGG